MGLEGMFIVTRAEYTRQSSGRHSREYLLWQQCVGKLGEGKSIVCTNSLPDVHGHHANDFCKNLHFNFKTAI